MTDTHSHLYLDQFRDDCDILIENAVNAGINKILLPNIDSRTIAPMTGLEDRYPDIFRSMIGLHPGSVREDYEKELGTVRKWSRQNDFCAIGEIGVDLYWEDNKKYLREQTVAFREQLKIAKELDLPVVIHLRNSFREAIEIVKQEASPALRGVFHCFSGNFSQASEAVGLGFYLGIGGVVTFKNSGLAAVVKQTDIKYILLETDAPFLAPAPFRGKRNIPEYLLYIAGEIARLKGLTLGEVARITSENAIALFRL
ncbi:MAG: TatD family hydrolase [Bacteroidetes bacterium]|nr:TatD family hydrolase [Bacteroidota bacterium]